VPGFWTMFARELPSRSSKSRFVGGSVVPVTTAYGKVDCLLERGRQGWGRPRRGAGLLAVADVPVLVAASADAWDLRRRFKEDEDELAQRPGYRRNGDPGSTRHEPVSQVFQKRWPGWRSGLAWPSAARTRDVAG